MDNSLSLSGIREEKEDSMLIFTITPFELISTALVLVGIGVAIGYAARGSQEVD
jgi:hypothetical protein